MPFFSCVKSTVKSDCVKTPWIGLHHSRGRSAAALQLYWRRERSSSTSLCLWWNAYWTCFPGVVKAFSKDLQMLLLPFWSDLNKGGTFHSTDPVWIANSPTLGRAAGLKYILLYLSNDTMRAEAVCGGSRRNDGMNGSILNGRTERALLIWTLICKS